MPPATQQELEETQRRCRLIANSPTTGMKSQSATRAFTVDLLSGRLRLDHTLPSLEHCSMKQTSHPAATGSKMSAKSLQRRWKHEIQTGLLRRRAAMTRAGRILPHGLNGSSPVSLVEPSIAAATCPLWMVDLVTTTKRIPRLTRQYQMTTMTSPPSSVNRSHPCSHQLVLGVAPLGAVYPRPAMNFLGDLGVSGQIFVEMSALGLETYRRCFPAQPALSA